MARSLDFPTWQVSLLELTNIQILKLKCGCMQHTLKKRERERKGCTHKIYCI